MRCACSGYDIHKRWTLIHENDYVGEVRWEEGDEIVTHVTLLKDGLIERWLNMAWFR